jgi:hypothetical protein
MTCERKRSVVRRFAVRQAWLSAALLAVWLPGPVAAGQSMPAAGQPLMTRGAGFEYLGARSPGALSAPPAIATGCLPAAPGLTSPLTVSKELRPLVRRMWEASPTFRRQCARLAEAVVTIVVELHPKMNRDRMNAFTQIQMVSGLVRAATTHLRVWEPEYLAHEIEHVLEQVDGVELRRSARGGLDGVHETQSSVFETARAIAIGRVVAREVAQWGVDR